MPQIAAHDHADFLFAGAGRYGYRVRRRADGPDVERRVVDHAAVEQQPPALDIEFLAVGLEFPAHDFERAVASGGTAGFVHRLHAAGDASGKAEAIELHVRTHDG